MPATWFIAEEADFGHLALVVPLCCKATFLSFHIASLEVFIQALLSYSEFPVLTLYFPY